MKYILSLHILKNKNTVKNKLQNSQRKVTGIKLDHWYYNMKL